MNKRALTVLALVTIGLPTSLLLGKGTGVLPREPGIPPNLNTGFPSCGATQCHNPFPNFNVEFGIQGATSVRKGGGAVPITTTVKGANLSSTKGGFSLEATAGTFVAQGNTRVGTVAGRSTITHTNSQSRSWTFNYNPPATTGLVRMFGTANAANGDGRSSGDAWGWFGPDGSVPGNAHRVFVNDTAIFPFGTSCEGSKVQNSNFRYRPVFGIAKNAAVGGTFQSEVHNVPPGTAAVGIFGLSRTQWGAVQLPLDLRLFGASGCFLRVSMDLLQPAVTTGSGAGNGVGKHNWAIPNIATLRGLDVYLQCMTLDTGANGLNLTFSMGLRANIQ